MTGKTTKISGMDLNALRGLRFEAVGAGVLIFATIIFVLLWRFNSAEIKRLESAIALKTAEAARMQAEVSTIKGLEAAVEEASQNLLLLEERLKTMNERLPSDRHISRLLADLSDSGQGVKIVSIKPLAPEDKGELARLPFQISMESRFAPFGAYVERIESLPRLMVIDNISIEPKDDGSNVLNTSVYLSAYVLGYGGRK